MHWNQVISRRTRDFCTFTALKSKCPHRFWGIEPLILHVFNVPLLSPLRMLFFALEMWDPLRPKIYKKYENPDIWRKKKKKTSRRTFVKGSPGAHKTRVQNVRLYRSKTSWTLDSEEFGAISLNQPVHLYRDVPRRVFVANDYSPFMGGGKPGSSWVFKAIFERVLMYPVDVRCERV